MSVQIAGVGARHARHVAEARARPGGSASPWSASGPRACEDEHVGQHVRQVAERRHQPVVRGGVDRHRRAPTPRRSGAGARRAGRRSCAAASGTRRRPEQVGARVLDAGRLRAGDRVAADEARVVARPPQLPAWSSPRRVTTQSAPAAVERARAPAPAARRPARRRSTTSAPSTASATESAALSIAPQLDGARASRSGSRPKPTTSAPSTCSWAASPIDPPIKPTPRTAILIRHRRGGPAPLPRQAAPAPRRSCPSPCRRP